MEPKEPLDAPVWLLGRGPGGFSGDGTFLENLDYTKKRRRGFVCRSYLGVCENIRKRCDVEEWVLKSIRKNFSRERRSSSFIYIYIYITYFVECFTFMYGFVYLRNKFIVYMKNECIRFHTRRHTCIVNLLVC